MTPPARSLYLVDQGGVLWFDRLRLDAKVRDQLTQLIEKNNAVAFVTGRSRVGTLQLTLNPLMDASGNRRPFEEGRVWAHCDKGAATLFPDGSGNYIDEQGRLNGQLDRRLAVPPLLRQQLRDAALRHATVSRGDLSFHAFEIDETKEATFTVLRVTPREADASRIIPTDDEYRSASDAYLREVSRVIRAFPNMRCVPSTMAVGVEHERGGKEFAAATALTHASTMGLNIDRVVVIGDSPFDDPSMIIPVRRWVQAEPEARRQAKFIYVGDAPLGIQSDDAIEVVETRELGATFVEGTRVALSMELGQSLRRGSGLTTPDY